MRSPTGLRQPGALERCFVVARNDPGFVGDARSVGAERDIVSARFNYPRGLTFLLSENGTKNAALFRLEVLSSRAQLVKHAPRHKHGRVNLRRGMAEFRAG